MDRELLRALNPDKHLETAGTTLRVANVADRKLNAGVARIAVIKSRESVWVFDSSDTLIAAYPATIDNDDNPSPRGTHEVQGVAIDPTYTYDSSTVEGLDAKEALQIAPGRNDPISPSRDMAFTDLRRRNKSGARVRTTA
jgi:lipoprotein-anchoring transpeptidase ErfK/SrfK